MLKKRESIVLIGAGVIGMLAAVRLAEAGFAVTIVDQGQIGREASWAGGGILSPLYPWHYPPELLRLSFYSMSLHRALSSELASLTNIDPQWTLSGLRIIDGENEVLPDDIGHWGQNWGLNWQISGGKAITPKNLWCPEVAQVRNPRLLSALAERCRQLDIKLLEHTEITGFRHKNEQLLGVESKQGFLASDKAIVTAGAWTGKLLEQIDIHLQIYPVRGQMLLLQGSPGMLDSMVMQDNHYLVQRQDGLILAGSTSENVQFDKSVTPLARQILWNFARDQLSGLNSSSIIRQWSGLRPGSPESVPYIGPLPGWNGLYVAAGHFRYGLTNAPATAEILTCLLTDKAPPIDTTPYNPATHYQNESQVFP
ncbi:FAD-dependent oxidoreductase [Acidithiobacillus sp. HP-6]|uniref:NAD(P)/FAD-dependent oxidoreductase n=1 Tax=unclassified Acidithiobacillus TaxID=2614800 RepID=UPI0018797EE4|nr:MULTISPECIES: FAD-dependent oxidoreductase [unclassified Acidithiobacillus]MBE7561387.1 FAD-dependent oxidoreductase [Acidithiobacillus sp. HP-6]MBE7570111.1 FAD-dependent oxidoreductase [Acidithiobacillus sp. HP-2]MDD2749479.1 FAD-dependent oxidoreductase [Acidithiobacillus sp.]MDD5278061.1 FAD-dependent oxidoreductase [Acidithiobacillus sp.]